MTDAQFRRAAFAVREAEALAVEIGGRRRGELLRAGARELEAAQECRTVARGGRDDALTLLRVEKNSGFAVLLDIIRERFQAPGRRVPDVAEVERAI
ncbi:MAG: hypothetical protein E6K32_02015 [Gammaproteobacteria bacterium]|nr:MAG: hypothetical protein E6K32_02015 [Gammaproteobacteria bacterium]